MKLAIVTPPHGFPAIDEVGLGYHMALGQYLLTDSAYRDYYRSLGKRGHFIIVDNGAAENNTPPFHEVVEAANYVLASEIILPDVINDSEATLAALFDSNALGLVPAHKRFVVPQGKTLAEWFNCFGEINNGIRERCGLTDISFATLGISKYFPKGRKGILDSLYNAMPPWEQSFNVHMLGMVGMPYKEMRDILRNYSWVRGIDTGAPIAWAQAHSVLSDMNDERHSLSWTKDFSIVTATLNIHALQGARWPKQGEGEN